MEFTTEKQERAFLHVGGLLEELFGSWVRIGDDESPRYLVQVGSWVAYVSIFPWAVANDAVVQVASFAAIAPDLDTGLPTFLLRENESLRLGGFAIDPEGDVAFIYSFPASAVSKEFLNWAIQAVMSAVERYSRPIVERWGGRTWEGPASE